MNILDPIPEPKAAKAAHEAAVTALRLNRNITQRLAEAAFIPALSLLIGAAVIPW
uniref:hypothetical protein n=1 Tax=Microbacterium proteolyticum TaxID=1572644 RepID=UPI002415C2F6|nr:hypothetical protein [Microbacterium proteolyticum]